MNNILFFYLISDTDNQRVIIKVKDVNDEPPYFINRPLPMQAVVKLNAPPNTRVFTLQAKDPDTDHNIHYFLVRDRTGGRFEVDERSGVVRTRGTEPFQLDMEYVLYVKAEDQNGRDGNKWQSTPEERLSIGENEKCLDSIYRTSLQIIVNDGSNIYSLLIIFLFFLSL